MWESAGEQMWCCPFCQQRTIKVFYRPSHRETRTARGSGVSNSFSVRKNPEVTVLSEKCSNCGKPWKEIEGKI